MQKKSRKHTEQYLFCPIERQDVVRMHSFWGLGMNQII